MKVLVVSDTHVPTLARRLPDQILEESAECEAIIHAGDLVSKSVADQFMSVNTLYAVHGNQDSPSLRSLLPSRRVVELEGKRIGVVHGHTGPGMYTEDRAFNAFSSEQMDVIVFGHSHLPLNIQRGNVLMFNPGSAVAGRGGKGNTYGILELGASLCARIIPVPR